MFSKILIANRGEIAVRVIQTAHRLGIGTVAVYSEADRHAPHVRMADEANLLGPAPPSESYLRIDKIIAAALDKGAQAIHPGYGFLSENAAFPIACEKAGLVFIGPSSKNIELMGSKSAAKTVMQGAGVPVLPGYQGNDQSVVTLRQAADEIGYPVLLKAAAGGGGKGMRLVETADEFENALKSAKREAKSAFGDDEFIVEKYLSDPRHVEVQVFGDNHSNVVHLFERDCSVQRRHQKVIEEAPAPNLPKSVREKLLNAGVDAAKAIDYSGAGTVEFLFDGQSDVYFMEMNTRLQVEHPVTEAITGIDLVEWQLRIAAGEALPLQQDDIVESGHSFEARLYAEDPDNEFLPSTGQLTTLRFPSSCRVDTGVEQGSIISPTYDPMIAKVITHGSTREHALTKLREALETTYAQGLQTNTGFLYALANHAGFAKAEVSTGFISHHESDLFHKKVPKSLWLSAAILHVQEQRQARQADTTWTELPGFRLNLPATQIFWFKIADDLLLVTIRQTGEHYRVSVEQNMTAADRKADVSDSAQYQYDFCGQICDGYVDIEVDGKHHEGFLACHEDQVRIWFHGNSIDIELTDPQIQATDHATDTGGLTAPMPGTIIELNLAPDTTVSKGDTLMVMEAMKMEHAIKAPGDGVLKSYRFQAGDLVDQGEILVDFEAD